MCSVPVPFYRHQPVQCGTRGWGWQTGGEKGRPYGGGSKASRCPSEVDAAVDVEGAQGHRRALLPWLPATRGEQLAAHLVTPAASAVPRFESRYPTHRPYLMLGLLAGVAGRYADCRTARAPHACPQVLDATRAQFVSACLCRYCEVGATLFLRDRANDGICATFRNSLVSKPSPFHV